MLSSHAKTKQEAELSNQRVQDANAEKRAALNIPPFDKTNPQIEAANKKLAQAETARTKANMEVLRFENDLAVMHPLTGVKAGLSVDQLTKSSTQITPYDQIVPASGPMSDRANAKQYMADISREDTKLRRAHKGTSDSSLGDQAYEPGTIAEAYVPHSPGDERFGGLSRRIDRNPQTGDLENADKLPEGWGHSDETGLPWETTNTHGEPRKTSGLNAQRSALTFQLDPKKYSPDQIQDLQTTIGRHERTHGLNERAGPDARAGYEAEQMSAAFKALKRNTLDPGSVDPAIVQEAEAMVKKQQAYQAKASQPGYTPTPGPDNMSQRALELDKGADVKGKEIMEIRSKPLMARTKEEVDRLNTLVGEQERMRIQSSQIDEAAARQAESSARRIVNPKRGQIGEDEYITSEEVGRTFTPEEVRASRIAKTQEYFGVTDPKEQDFYAMHHSHGTRTLDERVIAKREEAEMIRSRADENTKGRFRRFLSPAHRSKMNTARQLEREATEIELGHDIMRGKGSEGSDTRTRDNPEARDWGKNPETRKAWDQLSPEHQRYIRTHRGVNNQFNDALDYIVEPGTNRVRPERYKRGHPRRPETPSPSAQQAANRIGAKTG